MFAARAASVSLALVALAVACGGSDGGSASGDGGNTTGSVRCHSTAGGTTTGGCIEHFEDCENGSYYDVKCNGSTGSWSCTCSVDGVAGNPVTDPGYCDLDHPARRDASNVLCGWKLM